MSIMILVTDLRSMPAKLEHFTVNWTPNMTALQAIAQALGEVTATGIENDLRNNSQELIVSWYDTRTGEHSEIGGMGTLTGQIAEDSLLTISYENENTTQSQIDESIEWTLKVTGGINWPPLT